MCFLLSRAYELNEFIAHTVRVAGALLQGKERHIFAEVQLIAHAHRRVHDYDPDGLGEGDLA